MSTAVRAPVACQVSSCSFALEVSFWASSSLDVLPDHQLGQGHWSCIGFFNYFVFHAIAAMFMSCCSLPNANELVPKDTRGGEGHGRLGLFLLQVKWRPRRSLTCAVCGVSRPPAVATHSELLSSFHFWCGGEHLFGCCASGSCQVQVRQGVAAGEGH